MGWLIPVLVLAFTASLKYCEGQRLFCYYYRYYNYLRYDCSSVPQCTNYQRTTYYAQRSYYDCCGTQAVVTSGQCCRYEYTATAYYNYRQSYCMCSNGAICTKKSITAKPTPKPTTTTTTTTTKKPTTTTKKPTTTTTTAKPTTTTTTTTAKTNTTPAKKLCPTYRLLNSEAANECDYPGITSIEQTLGTTASINACNAILVPANINGSIKSAFFTSKVCKQQLKDLAISGKAQFNFKIGNKTYPIDIGSMFDIIDEPTKGSAFFVIKDRFASLLNFQGTCQEPACVMTKSMIREIDYSDCDVVSYGVATDDLSYKGLRKVKVQITNNDLCSNLAELFGEVNTMCFATVSGKNLYCSNDMGAGVFCRARSGEKILIGTAALQVNCDSSPYFRLIPYPITKT